MNFGYSSSKVCNCEYTHVMVLLTGIREMTIDRGRPDRSDPQLALLRHRFASIRDSADQVAVGRVREPRSVRRVR